MMDILLISDSEPPCNQEAQASGTRLKTPDYVDLPFYECIKANPDAIDLSRSLKNHWGSIDNLYLNDGNCGFDKS
jgi:hypothetical protein